MNEKEFKTLIVVGHCYEPKTKPNMTKEITDYFNKQGYQVINFDYVKDITFSYDEAIIVYVGKGRQLEESIAYASCHNIPFIQGASGQKLITAPGCPIIEIANFALVVNDVIYVAGILAKALEPYDFTVKRIEDHQSSKTSEPSTAKLFDNAVNPDEKFSVRNRPEIHATHEVQFIKDGTQVSLKIEMQGRQGYVEGLEIICKRIQNKRKTLENRLYKGAGVF